MDTFKARQDLTAAMMQADARLFTKYIVLVHTLSNIYNETNTQIVHYAKRCKDFAASSCLPHIDTGGNIEKREICMSLLQPEVASQAIARGLRNL